VKIVVIRTKFLVFLTPEKVFFSQLFFSKKYYLKPSLSLFQKMKNKKMTADYND